ncbi:hypothetical protein H4217_003692 [Coemansia sp. RSA 1939]|nr:hypothetical protein H4217_003692 [Coemansia sp. RSA 1939]
MQIGPDGKRQRVSRACDKCRRKKVKCDGKHPVCSHCEELGYECTYLDATKKRGPPKGYIEVIESRLHKLEELVRGLSAANPAAARYIYDVLQDPESGIDASVLADTSGAIFGSMTMADLKMHAAQDRHQNNFQEQRPLTPEIHDNRDIFGTDVSGTSYHTNPCTDVSHTAAQEHDSSSQMMARSADPLSSSQNQVNDPVHNLTHLEKRVGHLTLDPTGSLRYLGDSSGWYIINHNLVSLKSSSRLKKGPSGAFRWPPITTIATRESDTTDPSGAHASSSGAAAAAAAASAASSGGDPANAVSALSSAPGSLQQNVEIANGESVADGQNEKKATNAASSTVVAVPRNLPPCAKPPMPDVEEQANLLSLYFRYVHPVFPILSKSHLLERAFDKERPLAPALMSAVFAAASTYKAREAKSKDDLARVRIQMAVHFQRAKLYLDEQYTNNSLSAILTLLLMSVYEQGTMSTRSWLYSGMAIRKAYDMGLHRDMGAAKHNELSVVSKREADMRLRAWWGCYIMDIMVSATLGRPTTIRDFTFDAPFPDNFGDDNDELLVSSSLKEASSGKNSGAGFGDSLESPVWRHEQALGNQTHTEVNKETATDHRRPSHESANVIVPVAECMRDYVALTIGDPESDASDTERDDDAGNERQTASRGKPHGVYYLDLLHIFGHVLTEMYTCKPNRSYAVKYCFYGLRSRTERLIALDHELRQWMDSLPSELRYPLDDILAARPARCVYIALIHLVYYTAMILLHRPFISRLGSSHQPTHACAMPSMDEGRSNSKSKGFSTSDHPPESPNSADETRHHPRAGKSSPLPSHSICTVSAQMISLIGQAIIQDSRIFIMPFLTFMMFTAGTMHLNNVIVAADSWIARRFLKRTLNVMSRLGAHWQVSYKCYTMLNTLVRANRIGLDQLVEDDRTGIRVIKERYRENTHISQLVYEERFPHHTWSSPDQPDRDHSPRSPLKADASSHIESHRNESGLSIGSGNNQTTRSRSNWGVSATKMHDTAGSHSRLHQLKTQTSGSQPLESMDVFENQPMVNSSEPSEQIPDPETGAHGNPQDMCHGDNVYTSALEHHGSSFNRMPPAPYNPTRHRYAADAKIPMFMRIPALRRFVGSDGRPVVPPSPYTSVNVSNTSNTAAEATIRGTQQDFLESSTALGQFVPSLEFFANAEFPLGIGGPNGQASLALPKAMAAHSAGSSILGGSSGYSDKNRQLLDPGLITKSTEMGSVLDVASFSAPTPKYSTSSVAEMKEGSVISLASAAQGSSFPAFGNVYSSVSPVVTGTHSDVLLPAATLPREVGTATSLMSSGETATDGSGFERSDNTSNNNPTPANMGFSGMLIDDDVIRNLPFSGPVSYDLGVGGMEGLSAMLSYGSGGGGGANASSLSDAGASRVLNQTNPLSSIPNGLHTENDSSEMPWKVYVDQVIRMFEKNASNGNGEQQQ